MEDDIVAQSVDQAAQLWSYREAVIELLSSTQPCVTFDVSVFMPTMEALVDELRERLSWRYPGKRHLFFGHLGDGKLHLISGPYPDRHELEDVADLVYRCVGRHRGSVSAEHGIGVMKKAHLHHSRSIEEITLMTPLEGVAGSAADTEPRSRR